MIQATPTAAIAAHIATIAIIHIHPIMPMAATSPDKRNPSCTMHKGFCVCKLSDYEIFPLFISVNIGFLFVAVMSNLIVHAV